MTEAKGICEYCEKATDDIYRYTNIKAFSRFAHLKRIAYHLRDELERLSNTKVFMEQLTIHNKALGLDDVLNNVKERMHVYGDQYGTDNDGSKELSWLKTLRRSGEDSV